MKKQMNFAEALPYQECFDAVLADKATLAQAIEVDAVVNGVHRYMQAAGSKASQLIDSRTNLLAGLPEDKHKAVHELLDGTKNATTPRIQFDTVEQTIVTPDESTAAAVAREKAAAEATAKAIPGTLVP